MPPLLLAYLNTTARMAQPAYLGHGCLLTPPFLALLTGRPPCPAHSSPLSFCLPSHEGAQLNTGGEKKAIHLGLKGRFAEASSSRPGEKCPNFGVSVAEWEHLGRYVDLWLAGWRSHLSLSQSRLLISSPFTEVAELD